MMEFGLIFYLTEEYFSKISFKILHYNLKNAHSWWSDTSKNMSSKRSVSDRRLRNSQKIDYYSSFKMVYILFAVTTKVFDMETKKWNDKPFLIACPTCNLHSIDQLIAQSPQSAADE